MKSYLIGIASVFFIFLACCKKEDDRQYSYWNVNNESFSSNDMRVDKGKARCEFGGNDFSNRLFLVFNLGFFPTSGTFKLDCSQQNPNWACLSLNYKGVGYFPSSGNIQASESNGRAKYTLKPTWFVNETISSDSVLVSGTLNEP